MNESTVTIPLSEYMKLQDEVKEFNKLKELLEECPVDSLCAVQLDTSCSPKQKYIKQWFDETTLKDKLNIYYKNKYEESLNTIRSLKEDIRINKVCLDKQDSHIKYLNLEYSTLADKYDKLKDNIPSSFIDFIKYKFKNEK